MRRRLLPLLTICVLLAALGCDSDPGSASEETPEWPIRLSADWTTTSPETVGASSEGLESALQVAIGIERLKSLVVVKDGVIIMEEYLHGAESSDLFDVRSVTKSIVSTLVGMAIKDGYIPDMNATIGERLSFVMEDMDEVNQSVTIHDLLTMSGGWQYDEWNGPSYQQWIASGQPERWPLVQPRVAAPGAQFTYNSAAVHLLGVLTEQFLDCTLIQYASQELLTPIGIVHKQWEMLPGGYPNGGAGIDLQARDLARFGQLFLQDGMSGDRRILPEDWVAEATTPAYSWRSSFGPLKEMSYGYLWWTDDNGGDPVYLAWGYGGQFVYVKPSSRLVVVTTTDWSGVNQEPGGESAVARAAMNLIHTHVVPAVDGE
jgi:CubicO group peptidase (beta-lactamase class C family)